MLDGDDQLRDHRQNFAFSTLVYHIATALKSDGGIGRFDLAKAGEKYGQVVMKVELIDVDLPE